MKRRFQNLQDLPAEFHIGEPLVGIYSVRGTVKDGSTVFVQLDRVIKTATATKRKPAGSIELYDLLANVSLVTEDSLQQIRILQDWLGQAKTGRAA